MRLCQLNFHLDLSLKENFHGKSLTHEIWSTKSFRCYCTFVPPPPRVRVRAMGKLSAASVINNKRRGGGGGGVVWKCNSTKFYWWSIIDLYLMTWIHHSNFYFVQDYTISIPCLLNAICYYLLLCILTTKPVKYFYSYRFLVGMGDKQVSM